MKTVTCPHCNETKPSRHPGMCSKNPNRLKRTKGAASPSSESHAPVIEVQQSPVPEDQLPSFESPPETPATSAPTTSASPQAGTPPQAPPQVTGADVIRPLIDLAFDQLEKKLDEMDPTQAPKPPDRPAPIPQKDRDAVSTVYGLLLDKYLPGSVQTWGLEAAALVLTLTVVVPKLFEYRAYWKYKTAQYEHAQRAQQLRESPPSGATFTPPTDEDPMKAAGEAMLQRQRALEADLNAGR